MVMAAIPLFFFPTTPHCQMGSKPFNDARRREKLAELIGNYELTNTAEDLERMREDDPSHH